MLIFSAITPHPPLLIPTIGRENLKVIEKTQQAMERLAGDLYYLKQDTIIIIQPHGDFDIQKITINQSSILKADFSEFGDLVTKIEYDGDIGLAYNIYEYFETQNILRLIHQEEIDHGVSVPLTYLAKNLENTKIIPINYCAEIGRAHV